MPDYPGGLILAKDDLERHALIIKNLIGIRIRISIAFRKWLNTHEDLKPIIYGSAKSTMERD